jgi:hypothetical protein
MMVVRKMRDINHIINFDVIPQRKFHSDIHMHTSALRELSTVHYSSLSLSRSRSIEQMRLFCVPLAPQAFAHISLLNNDDDNSSGSWQGLTASTTHNIIIFSDMKLSVSANFMLFGLIFYDMCSKQTNKHYRH